MASKFQNRLVGTIILASLSVILLPALLDGQKKHYTEQFAAIPLIPQVGDTPNDIEVLPPVHQSLLPQTLAQRTEQLEKTDKKDAKQLKSQDSLATIALPSRESTELSAMLTENNDGLNEVSPKIQSENQQPKNKKITQFPSSAEITNSENRKNEKSRVEETVKEKAPIGQAYVVQLGALKNADKVNEIIATLRLSGYQTYTIPSKPVNGGITRIYVGPDISQQKLQAQLTELKQLSGLSGQVKRYQPSQ